MARRVTMSSAAWVSLRGLFRNLRRAGVAKTLDELCSKAVDTICTEAAVILVEGLIDPSLVAEGFKRLKGEELADALAAYGDIEGSLAEIAAFRQAFGKLDLESFGPEPNKTLRDATLRRVTAALVGGRIAEPPRGLLALLRFLGQNGDTEAPGYLKAIEGGIGQAGPPAPVGGGWN